MRDNPIGLEQFHIGEELVAFSSYASSQSFEVPEIAEAHDESQSLSEETVAQRPESCNEYNFEIILTSSEYENLVLYKRSSTKSRLRQCSFAPRVWTHVLHQKFVETTHLKCTLMFKRAKICLTGLVFAELYGTCSLCISKFFGKILSEPSAAENISIYCRFIGKFNRLHFDIKSVLFLVLDVLK